MDSYLVNFYHLDGNEEKKVCWFYCKAFAEMIQFLYFCKKYEVDFYIRTDSENIKEEDKSNIPKSVKDFNVNYGGEDCVQTIDVWLQ